MELTKGVGTWADWWILTAPTAKVLEYIRYNIPGTYRLYDPEGPVWRIHQKHVEAVRSLMNSSGVVAIDDPYAVLHLRPTAPPAIIKAVWREMAKELHPDRGGDEEQFKRLNAAYQKLIKV